jgi:hypothetical protein
MPPPSSNGQTVTAYYSIELPSLEFLNDTPYIDTSSVSWNGNVFHLLLHEEPNEQKTVCYSMPLTLDKVQELEKRATASLVGKNDRTVFDQRFRKSVEIPSARLKLDPDFEAMVKKHVTEAQDNLMHPITLEPQLHKLIIYRPGDFFAQHIDAIHSPNIIATTSVELFVDGQPSDNLKVDIDWERQDDDCLLVETTRVPSASRELPVSLATFWHDCQLSIRFCSPPFKFLLFLLFSVRLVAVLF